VDIQALVHRRLAPGSWLSVIEADWQSRIATSFAPVSFFF
jgi:hypothetical protein